MREIKFRIFIGGKFSYWGFMNGGFVGLPSTTLESVDMKELEKRSQQYTGLKDENGKETFEGDILTSLYKSDGCKGLYEVVWCVCGFRPRRFKEHQQIGVMVTMSDLQRCEIIGNIYENKELLNAKSAS